jgi:hypothetical protein
MESAKLRDFRTFSFTAGFESAATCLAHTVSGRRKFPRNKILRLTNENIDRLNKSYFLLGKPNHTHYGNIFSLTVQKKMHLE